MGNATSCNMCSSSAPRRDERQRYKPYKPFLVIAFDRVNNQRTVSVARDTIKSDLMVAKKKLWQGGSVSPSIKKSSRRGTRKRSMRQKVVTEPFVRYPPAAPHNTGSYLTDSMDIDLIPVPASPVPEWPWLNPQDSCFDKMMDAATVST